MGRSMNLFTFIAILLLFLLCTIHFTLNFSHVFNGLIVHPDPDIPISLQTFDSLLSNVAFTTTDFVGQIVLIYRCWKIYEKNHLVVVLPVLLSLGSYAVGLAGVIMLLEITSQGIEEPPALLVALGISTFSLSLTVNVLVTFLILYRIYTISRVSRESNKRHKQSGLDTAIEAIVESGALFMFAQIAFVTLFALKNNGQLVGVAIAAQIYGIAPTMLIARVAVGRSMENGVNGRETSEFSRVTVSTMIASFPQGNPKVFEAEGQRGGSSEYV